MRELTLAGNALSALMLGALAPALPGATLALFDSHAFFSELHAHPGRYFNGSAPANVTGAVSACVLAEGEDPNAHGACTYAHGAARDSFMWADELHPSEQTDRLLAQQILANVRGESARYISFLRT
jgi:phospholipase/lecithinase/hemolysin